MSGRHSHSEFLTVTTTAIGEDALCHLLSIKVAAQGRVVLTCHVDDELPNASAYQLHLIGHSKNFNRVIGSPHIVQNCTVLHSIGGTHAYLKSKIIRLLLSLMPVLALTDIHSSGMSPPRVQKAKPSV